LKINGYPRLSEIVANNSTSFTKNVTQISGSATQTAAQLAAMLGCTVTVVTAEAYAGLTPDSGTLYIVKGDTNCTMYYGALPIAVEGGGGGGGNVGVSEVSVSAVGLSGTVATASEVK